MVKQHFRMDTLIKVLNLVKPNDWAIFLDLKDAYLHVPIHKSHRKHLRFCIQGKVYQFVALCFGPTQSPRCFTKIISVVTAHLRMQTVRLASYLDDKLIVNAISWLVGCFGLNGLLRQYFSLYRAVSQREGEGKDK